MRLVKLLGALALMFGSTQMAWAANASEERDCTLRFADPSATITILPDELGSGASATGEQFVRVVAEGSGAATGSCIGDIRVSRVSGDSTIPEYRLTLLERPIVPSISEAVGGPRNQFNVTLSGNRTSRDYVFRAAIPTGWGLTAGQHSEQLQLTLLDTTGAVTDRMTLNILLEVPKAVDVMLVGATGTGRGASVELGDLSTTETTRSSPLGLRIWSTSPYTYDFQSENGGMLMHTLGMDAIPYEFWVEGRPLALQSGPVMFMSTQASSARGDLYSMRIEVPARRSIAGEYRDRITISVSAI